MNMRYAVYIIRSRSQKYKSRIAISKIFDNYNYGYEGIYIFFFIEIGIRTININFTSLCRPYFDMPSALSSTTGN